MSVHKLKCPLKVNICKKGLEKTNRKAISVPLEGYCTTDTLSKGTNDVHEDQGAGSQLDQFLGTNAFTENSKVGLLLLRPV